MNQIHERDQADQQSGVDLCRAMQRGLEEEIKALAAFDANRRSFFARGRWKSSKGLGHLYAFELQEALREANDSRLTLRFADQDVSGMLVSSQGLQAHIVFERYLGEELPHCQIVLDRAVLFRALRERLGELENHPGSPGLNLARELLKPLGEGAADHRHFIWGPPGTGKTHALAQIAVQSLQRGERVLLTGHTHRAVNVALARIGKHLREAQGAANPSAAKAFKILRFGYHPQTQARNNANGELFQDSSSAELQSFLPEQFLRLQDSALYEKKIAAHLALKQALDQMQEWQRNHRIEGEQVKALRHDILLLEKTVEKMTGREKKMVREVIPTLDLLACTMTQVFLNEDIAAGKFDTLIVDEASQINLPALFYAASLVGKKIIVVGDFRQMPPIALSKSSAAQLMATDIFSWVGFEQKTPQQLQHFAEVTVLRKQRRMRPSIAQLVSDNFYQGWLENDDSVVEREKTASEPALYFLDTPSALAFSTKKGREGGGSRINLVHAVLALRCAERFLQERLSDPESLQRKIAIITPYREQVKLLDHMIEDRGLKRFVDVATIHQFQGEERDIVIFDSVESPGANPSPLLDGPLGSPAARSMNVAFSRAREVLVVIANREFLQNALSKTSVLHDILKYLTLHAPSPLPELVREALDSRHSDLVSDLAAAKKSVVFLMPLLFGNIAKEVQAVLQNLCDQGVSLFFDTLGAKFQRVALKTDFHGQHPFCQSLHTKILCHDFPEWRQTLNQNLILIDEDTAWFAAENIFSASSLFKISGRKTIAGLHHFFGFSMLRQAPHLDATCPLCGGQMVTMWNRRRYESQGDFYAGCGEGCGYNRPLLKHETRPLHLGAQAFPSLEPHAVQRAFPGFLPGLPKKEKLVLPVAGRQALEHQCPQCGRRRQIRFKEGQYLFTGCAGYPQCNYRTGYQEPCSKCSSQMVVRRSQTGIFLGCSAFPNCKNTQTLSEGKVKSIIEKDLIL